MNTETKRHIDAARQVLVGVVPNPTSQIDQVTNALIYKFMDDMDQSAIKQGGEPSFFVGDLKDYAWTRLMDARIGNQERMNIYSEALVKFSESKQLPQLFRDIFKSAFLPYRSPEVLGMFLKEIDYFDYSHPEELGNAYEYLLSIMSSQGAAGQFRTPRHIIDFMVAVVAPTAEDKVLDPSCGTGGFLVSAYNHILKQHDGKNPDGSKNDERSLTPDQRKNLMNNFEGYDVDPGMVRIAQVNMYLHQFKNPKIYNYNTLAMDERWGDKFDVILANPPFMSPKGGISTHNKFSVQSTRSEVLFVDYIMNHLKPKGRAGIIVPEGIIFQSGTSYKQLRKNLVEDGLFAVVSLPQGVFNPYAGVKTSILFFDNTIAKKTDKILFVRVLNDGFDLGAQRRPIDRNDLVRPSNEVDATKVLRGQRVAIETGTKNPWLQENSLFAYEISKEQIAQSGDYNLSAEGYRLNNLGEQKAQKWPVVNLGELCQIGTGKNDVNQGNPDGQYPFFTCAREHTFSDSYSFDMEALLIAGNGDVGHVKYFKGKFEAYQRTYILSDFKDIVLVQYLFCYLSKELKPSLEIQKLGNTMPYIKLGMLSDFKIPLPPINVQKEIVEQIEVKQKAIDGAKQVIINLEREREYFGQSLRKLENTLMIKLGEICTFEYGKPLKEEDRESGEYPVFGSNGIVGYHNEYLVDGPLVIVGRKGTAGAVTYSEKNGYPIDTAFYVKLLDEDKVDLKFLYLILRTVGLNKVNTQSGVPGLNRNDAYKIKIPLPLIEIQKEMVEEIEKEERIITSNHKLIKIMEKKIENVLETI